MKFKLYIRLGNEAMETDEDVAHALVKVAKKLEAGYRNGSIMDDNGNKVGEYGFEGSGRY